MFSEEDKKRFPKPKPDNSPTKRVKTIAEHEALVAPLREKRTERTRQGGSWLLIEGKLVPNEDDRRKGKKPVEETEGVDEIEPSEKVEILPEEEEIEVREEETEE